MNIDKLAIELLDHFMMGSTFVIGWIIYFKIHRAFNNLNSKYEELRRVLSTWKIQNL